MLKLKRVPFVHPDPRVRAATSAHFHYYYEGAPIASVAHVLPPLAFSPQWELYWFDTGDIEIVASLEEAEKKIAAKVETV
mgnify:CR=1 FL=1